MAGKVDVFKPNYQESRFSPVDHSDVYLENVRLTEGLLVDLDTIQRRRHRQLIARRAEIQALKESFDRITQLQDYQNMMSASKRQREISRLEHNPELVISQYQTSVVNDGVTGGVEHAEEEVNLPENTPSSSNVKSISVKMPSADKSAVTDDSDSDAGGGSRRHSITGRRRESVNHDAHKNKPQKSPSTSKKSELEILMNRMKLQQFPKEWYTTVIPASDVQIRRRVDTPKPPSPDRRRRIVRSSTSIGDAPRKKKSYARTKSPVKSTASSPAPTVVTMTTLICHHQGQSKTKRQLQDMYEYDREPGLSDKEYLAQVARERRKEDSMQKRQILDGKVKDFLRSLEEMNKTSKKRTS